MVDVKLFNNMDSLIGDDLKETITNKSKVQIAAACFSIYAYKELKKSLKNIDELQFIFTSPTFISDIEVKSKKRILYKENFKRKKFIWN